jgi:hypothetical protein
VAFLKVHVDQTPANKEDSECPKGKGNFVDWIPQYIQGYFTFGPTT